MEKEYIMRHRKKIHSKGIDGKRKQRRELAPRWQLVHEASEIDSFSGLQDPWELCPAPAMRVSGPLCQARPEPDPGARVWEAGACRDTLL